MLREKIREHADWVAKILQGHPGITKSEATTKNSLIEPFLRCLHYDTTHPAQVALEVPTELGAKIDYVLTGQGNVKIAVEAKRAGITLSEKETNQLRSYFTFSEAVAGILTNGVDYWLFTDLEKTNVMDSEPYRKVDVRNLTNTDIRHLESLTRRSVNQNSIHQQAQRERYRTLVQQIVGQELSSPSQEFLKLVGKKVGIKPLTKSNLKLLEPLVREAISRNLGIGPPPPCPEGTPPAQVALFGKVIPAENYRQILTSVVTELQRRHSDFAERVLKEPFMKAGRKWQYISTDKKDLCPPHAKRKVGAYFVDVHFNARNAVKRARVFLKAFGHDPEELVVPSSFGKGPPSYPKIKEATLFGEAIPAKTYVEMLTSVVAELQARHPTDFADRVSDEKTFRGAKWWIISRVSDELGPRKTKRQVGDYWVYAGGTGRIPRAHKFLKAFGHDPDELVVHTSDG